MFHDCEHSKSFNTVSVVDTKSVFDVLSKNIAGSKADRRNSIEIAIIRDSLADIGSVIRWVPHGRMPAAPDDEGESNSR